MKRLWVLVVLLGVSIADLPSCERARCSHCDVKFIAKMCQKTCDACPRPFGDVYSKNRLEGVYQNNNRLPLPYQQGSTGSVEPVKFQNLPNKSPISVTLRQAGVPTQTQQEAPREVRFQQPYHNVQLAAPQSQLPAIQYPQQQQQQQYIGASTLAPLLSAPRPNEINSNLAQRPADLAQPFAQYNGNAQVQGGFPAQQQQIPQLQIPAPVQTPYYNTNQDPFSQPAATFAQPAYQQQQQPSQNTLQYPQQQPSTPLLNPFQPFMPQTGVSSAPSLLDPFNLFNLGALNLGQMSPTPSPFAQPQAGFGATPMANQPLQQPTLAQQQPQQGSFFGQPQQLQYDQQRQDNYNNPNVQQLYPGQQQQQVPQPQYQNVYSQQNNNYNLQQQQQRTPQPVNKQPLPQYRGNQPQPQQPRTQYQVTNALPSVPASSSIDAAPIHVHKYVDGKGPVPAMPPQQCPRQPGWAPCITKQQANERFHTCCARLGDGCTPLCNYDAPLATMQLAVLTGRCPLNKMADIMVCASGYEDATACCEAYNVFEPGYEQCRPYCNPAAGLPQGGLLSEKYKCLAKLAHIQQCFYVSQKP